ARPAGRGGAAAGRGRVQGRSGGRALAGPAPRAAPARLGEGRCVMTPIAECGLAASGVRWEVAAEYRDVLLGPDGLRLAEWLEAGLAQVVKHGPSRTVYRVTLAELSFYVKRCRLAGAGAWLGGLIWRAQSPHGHDKCDEV